MGENSMIEWTDHTFNPWWGCVKVAPGCKNCYAETFSNRYGHKVWGPGTERRMFGDKHWNQPVRWNRIAGEKGGRRVKVFCGSMCDVFEDHPQLDIRRVRLWNLIEATPNIDWLLLTKRPENIRSMVRRSWLSKPLKNVWYGTSITSTADAYRYIPSLLDVPAEIRFLSVEPMLSEVDISPWLIEGFEAASDPAFDAPVGTVIDGLERMDQQNWVRTAFIHWVICGGESGHNARELNPADVRKLRDDCKHYGVAFFFKQWGRFLDGVPVGKKVAGRVLDGETYSEYPSP